MKTLLLLAQTVILCTAPIVAVAATLPPSAAQQQALTPKGVLGELLDGNRRFTEGNPTPGNARARIVATADGQYPKAFILSCVDSRVPVEQVFDQGIGDLFVGRVAGNVESVDQLGSIEFATKVAGAKLVMVLGHEACGAVKGACDHVELGNLTALLHEIKPAVQAVTNYAEGKRTSKNKDFVEAVIAKNVELTVADLRKRSPLLAEMEKAGQIMIVGALYSLHTGKVTLLSP
jgi:carbonic anhydrase